MRRAVLVAKEGEDVRRYGTDGGTEEAEREEVQGEEEDVGTARRRRRREVGGQQALSAGKREGGRTNE